MTKKEIAIGIAGGAAIVAAVLVVQFVLTQVVCNGIGC